MPPAPGRAAPDAADEPVPAGDCCDAGDAAPQPATPRAAEVPAITTSLRTFGFMGTPSASGKGTQPLPRQMVGAPPGRSPGPSRVPIGSCRSPGNLPGSARAALGPRAYLGLHAIAHPLRSRAGAARPL